MATAVSPNLKVKELIEVFSCEEYISMLTSYLFTVIMERDTLSKES